MDLTGNELLTISQSFLDEMRKKYLNLPLLPVDALKSVIFTHAQIDACIITDAVGIGFIRVKNSIDLKTEENAVAECLVAVSVDTKGVIIGSNGGIAPLSTCPRENCPSPPQILRTSNTINKIEIGKVNDLRLPKEDNPLIKLGGIYFSRSAIMFILAQSSCEGIMAFIVNYPNNFHGLAICGVNSNGNPQIGSGQLIAYSNINI